MGRFSKVRRPTAAEVQQLQHMVATLPNARQRRRAEILVLYATGLAANAIAKLLGLHLNTVSHVLHLFKEHGLAAVTHMSVGGAPRQVSSYQVARIQRLADQPPTKRGLPYGRWSLAKLRDYVLQQRIVNRISREHLRRLLKKGAFVSSGFNAN